MMFKKKRECLGIDIPKKLHLNLNNEDNTALIFLFSHKLFFCDCLHYLF